MVDVFKGHPVTVLDVLAPSCHCFRSPRPPGHRAVIDTTFMTARGTEVIPISDFACLDVDATVGNATPGKGVSMPRH